MTNPAHTPVALDEKGLEAAYAATILGEDEYGNPVHIERDEAETAIRAYLSAVGGEVGETWETFCDHAYYDLWAVRRVGNTIFNEAFHVQSQDEAEALSAILNASSLARLKAQTGVVKALERLREYGDRAHDGSGYGTIFRFEGGGRFFLADADITALATPPPPEPDAELERARNMLAACRDGTADPARLDDIITDLSEALARHRKQGGE